MPKFITKLSIFAILLILCSSIIDVVLSSRLRTNLNRIWDSWNEVYNDTNYYDLVVIGASEVWRGYNPKVIDSIMGINSFNCAIDGSGINRQIIKYHKFCEIHGTPKIVIQSVDLSLLNQTYGYEREQFFPYFIFDRNLIRQYDKYENFSWAEKYVPCYRYLGYYDVILEALLKENTKYFHEELNKGFCASFDKWDGYLLALKDSIEFDLNDSISLTQLEDFLSEQESKGVKVILTFTPIYSDAIMKCVNLQEAYMLYDALAAKYNAYVWHYYEDSICTDTSYFYNATHLNKKGAEIFSEQLARDLDSLGILK